MSEKIVNNEGVRLFPALLEEKRQHPNLVLSKPAIDLSGHVK
jgi:hypothetical protein